MLEDEDTICSCECATAEDTEIENNLYWTHDMPFHGNRCLKAA